MSDDEWRVLLTKALRKAVKAELVTMFADAPAKVNQEAAGMMDAKKKIADDLKSLRRAYDIFAEEIAK